MYCMSAAEYYKHSKNAKKLLLWRVFAEVINLYVCNFI